MKLIHKWPKELKNQKPFTKQKISLYFNENILYFSTQSILIENWQQNYYYYYTVYSII